MPEAEEGNRTEDGKIVQVQTNGAVRAKDGNGNMLLVRTRVAYADEFCMFGKLVQVTWAAKRQ